MKKCLLLFLSFCTSVIVSEAQTAQVKYFDSSNFDLTVRPADDFFRYANGGWLKKTTIPASKTSWGTTSMLYEQSLNVQ